MTIDTRAIREKISLFPYGWDASLATALCDEIDRLRAAHDEIAKLSASACPDEVRIANAYAEAGVSADADAAIARAQAYWHASEISRAALSPNPVKEGAE